MSGRRYGLQLNIANSNLHLILCILLAGDIATNPGPVQSCRTPDNNCLEVLYLNARSVKSFVSTDNIPARNVCKITLLQDFFIIIIIKNFVCSPKGFSAYNYNMQFKIKLYYIYYSKSKLRLSIKTFIYMILRM
jgi:hypothetical protein